MNTIETIQVGEKRSLEVLVTREKVNAFAAVSGDMSPIHMDEEYAKDTKFKKCIVHGMLLASYISRLIGMELPGEGTIYEKQEIQFLKPLFVGDTVAVKVEVMEVIRQTNRVILKTECFNQNNEVIATGNATVLPRRK